MNKLRILAATLQSASGATLALAVYQVSGWQLAASLAAATAGFVLFSLWKDVSWMRHVWLVWTVIWALVGVYSGVPAGWLSIAVILCLGGWDVKGFVISISVTENIRGQSQLSRRHMGRVFGVLFVSLLFSLLGLSVQVGLNLWKAIALGILVGLMMLLLLRSLSVPH